MVKSPIILVRNYALPGTKTGLNRTAADRYAKMTGETT
jgi:hypothetical protein